MSMKKFYVGVKGLIHDNERGYLLLRAAKGYWDIPGGRMDDNENLEATLRRELSEELPGVELQSLGEIQGSHRLPHDIEGDISLVILYYLVSVKLPKEIVLSEEHESYIWVKQRADIPKEDLNPRMREIMINLITK